MNDSQNINPFPASFLNNRCSIKLRGVTTSNETFVEIHSKFMTDHAMADAMEQTWERMYTSMLSDLNRHMLMANQAAAMQVGHPKPRRLRVCGTKPYLKIWKARSYIGNLVVGIRYVICYVM